MGAEAGSTFGQTRGFLFADLRGYTDFVEKRGDDAAAKLLARYRSLVRTVVAGHEGAEIRTEGDSFFVLFPSASRAVTAALEIVDSAAAATRDDPGAPIHVGVGVHAGETAESTEGPIGSAVNVAARICAQAKAGEVLVSDTVRGLTRTRGIADFQSLGPRRLKGIAEPMALYRAVAPGTAVPTWRIGPGPSMAGGVGSRSWRALLAGVAILVIAGVVGYVVFFSRVEPPASSPSPSGSTNPGVGAASPSAPADQPPSAPSGATHSTPAVATSPPVSGSRIIYSRQIVGFPDAGCDEQPADAKMYVLDPNQPEVEPYRLTSWSNLIELDPSWSADGSTLAFVASIARGPGGLATADLSGETVDVLVPSREAPGINFFEPTKLVMAHDGSAFVHFSGEQIFRTSTDGSGLDTILEAIDPEKPEEPPTETFRDLEYRADGSLLLLSGPFEGAAEWLDSMADDGSDRERLGFDPRQIGGAPANFILGPDDDTAVFTTYSEQGSSRFIGRLSEGPASFERIDTDLTDPQRPQFSPDGTQLVVQAGGAAAEIYSVDLATGETTQLTDDPDALACTPTWQDAPPNLAQPRPTPAPGEARLFELGQLQPGTYLNNLVDPHLTLEFPTGWFARRSYVDGWSVFRPEVPGEVDSARIQIGLTTTCDDEEPVPVAIDPGPTSLISYLQAREDLVVSAPGAINLGGYTGLVIDVHGRAGKGCAFDPEVEPDMESWNLFSSGEDSFGLVTDELLKLIAIDVRGRTVSFLVFAFGDEADAYYAEHARPLLQTAEFPQE